MKTRILPSVCAKGPAVWFDTIDWVIDPGVTVNLEWRLLNENLELVSGRFRTKLTPTQYDNWVGGDEYVVETAAQNEGYVVDGDWVPPVDE